MKDKNGKPCRCGNCPESKPVAENVNLLLVVWCGKIKRNFGANSFCQVDE